MKKNVLFLYLIVILSLFSSVYCIINLKNKEEILDSENIHLLIFNMSLFSI